MNQGFDDGVQTFTASPIPFTAAEEHEPDPLDYVWQKQDSDPVVAASDTDKPTTLLGDPLYARTAYVCVALSAIALLAILMGQSADTFIAHTPYQLRIRMRTLHVQRLSNLTATHVILYALYADTLAFVVSATIVNSGIGLTSRHMCATAIYICIAFYVTSKFLMYMFLIERAHAVRAPYTRRLTDWIWCFFMTVLFVGLGALTTAALMTPVVDWSGHSCHIGLAPRASIALCVYDIITNFSLSGCFLWLLRPLLTFGKPQNVHLWKLWLTEKLKPYASWLPFHIPDMPAYRQTITRELVKARKRLVRKTLIGTTFVVFPSLVNLSLLYVSKGREMGWLCLILCSLDVTIAVCVIHWLTYDSSNSEGETSNRGGPRRTAGQATPGTARSPSATLSRHPLDTFKAFESDIPHDYNRRLELEFDVPLH